MTKKDSNTKYKEVNQFHLDDDNNIIDFINNLSNTGFNAKRLALACKIYEEMINDEECRIFFGLAGALVPAGFQGIIHDFIKEDFIDVLDPSIAPATGYAIPGGLSYRELWHILRALAKSFNIIGFDLVEVAPNLDPPNNVTANLAAKLIIEFISFISHSV